MAGRAQTSAQRKAAERWAAFVNRHLAARRWQQADLIRAAGTDSDGKPVLSSSRVSQWTTGKEGASPDYAVIVARAFGVPDAEALKATTAVEDLKEGPATAPAVNRYAQDDDEEFIAKLRASPDPKMHELADTFEADLERARRLARIEYNEIERQRTAHSDGSADANTSVNKSA